MDLIPYCQFKLIEGFRKSWNLDEVFQNSATILNIIKELLRLQTGYAGVSYFNALAFYPIQFKKCTTELRSL